MAYKVIKGNYFENFPKIWQHWAGDPLQGIYERYRYRRILTYEDNKDQVEGGLFGGEAGGHAGRLLQAQVFTIRSIFKADLYAKYLGIDWLFP